MTLSEHLYVNISVNKWMSDQTCDDEVQIYMHEETGNMYYMYGVQYV